MIVTGNGVNPYPAVRVAWLLDGATQTAAIVRTIANAYTATLTVPDEATPGAAKICATVTGTAQAEFACAPFTIDAPPPGGVSGQIPLTSTLQPGLRPQALNAFFALFDNAGTEVARTPINPDGSFTLNNVPRGAYQTGVIGDVPVLVETPPLNVYPGQITMAYRPVVRLQSGAHCLDRCEPGQSDRPSHGDRRRHRLTGIRDVRESGAGRHAGQCHLHRHAANRGGPHHRCDL